METPIRVAVMGCQGRMGKVLLEAIQAQEGVVLGAALERPGSAVIGLDAGELAGLGKLGVTIGDSLAAAIDAVDLIIDFTRPEVTLQNLNIAVAHHKMMVIGTTGFDDAGKQAISDAARQIGIEEIGMEARRNAFSQGESIQERQLTVQGEIASTLRLIMNFLRTAAPNLASQLDQISQSFGLPGSM